MSTQSISVKYRPIRIGFLIEEGNLASLAKACEINTVLWGGIHNPIIPVNDSTKTAKGMIDFFNVDVLFPIDQTQSIQQIVDGDKFRDLPMNGNLFYEDWHSKKQKISVLDVEHLFDYFWQENFKDKPKTFKSNFRIIEWNEDDPLSPFYTVRYGKFPNMNLLVDYQDLYLQALRGKRELIAKNTLPSDNLLKLYSPIRATGFHLTGYFGGGPKYGVYFGDPNSFSDLVQFWNLRTSCTRLEFIPNNQITDYKKYLEVYMEGINRLADSHPEIPDAIHLIIRNEASLTQLRDHLKEYKGKKRLVISELESDSLFEPSIFYFEWHIATTNLDKPYDRYQLSISLPRKNFLVEKENRHRGQLIAINLDPMTEIGYENHTLRLPNISGLNEFYSRETYFSPWGLRIGKDGITVIEESNGNLIQIYPLSFAPLMREVFKRADFKKVTASSAGIMASNVIKQMGDLEECRVFKMDCVRQLLSKTDPIQRSELQRTIQVDKIKYSDLFLVKGQSRGAPSEKQVITHLLDKKLITIGFYLTCRNCNLESWFSLKTIDELWTCQYCDASNSSVAQIYTHGTQHFRTSGIFTLEKKRQEGSIPVILTLLLLRRTLRDRGFIYSTALNIQDDVEVDLCVIEQLPSGYAVNMGIGECKDHTEIDDQDIANLKKVRENLLKLGIGCYLIFSKIAQFSEAEIKRFQQVSSEGVPIILLTGKELDEPFDPYWKNPDPKLPEKTASSLEDLHHNSVYLYLSGKTSN